eukprot:TRINITY_DN38028_c0_g1_i1.p1 TRINITY_DN38028_c0_g1~~TRINITY_DN38028_c0_g1_i1.p1  ORF type:complete len:969 (-),score=106.31 TRINITY_DN38028_c0_g1_i1:281-3187(-)
MPCADSRDLISAALANVVKRQDVAGRVSSARPASPSSRQRQRNLRLHVSPSREGSKDRSVSPRVFGRPRPKAIEVDDEASTEQVRAGSVSPTRSKIGEDGSYVHGVAMGINSAQRLLNQAVRGECSVTPDLIKRFIRHCANANVMPLQLVEIVNECTERRQSDRIGGTMEEVDTSLMRLLSFLDMLLRQDEPLATQIVTGVSSSVSDSLLSLQDNLKHKRKAQTMLRRLGLCAFTPRKERRRIASTSPEVERSAVATPESAARSSTPGCVYSANQEWSFAWKPPPADRPAINALPEAVDESSLAVSMEWSHGEDIAGSPNLWTGWRGISVGLKAAGLRGYAFNDVYTRIQEAKALLSEHRAGDSRGSEVQKTAAPPLEQGLDSIGVVGAKNNLDAGIRLAQSRESACAKARARLRRAARLLNCENGQEQHRLVFVSHRMQNANLLMDAVHEEAIGLLVDWTKLSLDDVIAECKQALGQGSRASSIAFVTHGRTKTFIATCEAVCPKQPPRSFWRILASQILAEGGRIDFLCCNVESDEMGRGLIATLQNAVTGVKFTTSSELTCSADTARQAAGMDSDELYFDPHGVERWRRTKGIANESAATPPVRGAPGRTTPRRGVSPRSRSPIAERAGTPRQRVRTASDLSPGRSREVSPRAVKPNSERVSNSKKSTWGPAASPNRRPLAMPRLLSPSPMRSVVPDAPSASQLPSPSLLLQSGQCSNLTDSSNLSSNATTSYPLKGSDLAGPVDLANLTGCVPRVVARTEGDPTSHDCSQDAGLAQKRSASEGRESNASSQTSVLMRALPSHRSHAPVEEFGVQPIGSGNREIEIRVACTADNGETVTPTNYQVVSSQIMESETSWSQFGPLPASGIRSAPNLQDTCQASLHGGIPGNQLQGASRIGKNSTVMVTSPFKGAERTPPSSQFSIGSAISLPGRTWLASSSYTPLCAENVTVATMSDHRLPVPARLV